MKDENTSQQMLHATFARDPFRNFYNLDGLTDVVLTTDIDWAPDYCIDLLLGLIAERGFKLTAFATGKSATLSSPPDFLEVGLHPDNTRPDPVNGLSRKILDLKDLYPSAVGMRAHRNFFGQNIADLAHRAGLRYDVSSILWNQTFAGGHFDYNGMARYSYIWEDGIHCDLRLPWSLDQINLNTPGLKILNVHPILIYLNSPDDDHRRAVTRRYADLASAPKSEIDSEINAKDGIRTFYESLLDHLKERSVRTHLLGEVTAAGKIS